MTVEQLAWLIFKAGYAKRQDGKWFPRQRPWAGAQEAANSLAAFLANGHSIKLPAESGAGSPSEASAGKETRDEPL